MATESSDKQKEVKPAPTQASDKKPPKEQTEKERAMRFVANGGDDW